LINLTVQTQINRPQADVYDFVVTHYVENHPRWDPRVVSTTLTSPPPLAVGSTGKEVRKQMGKENVYDFRVTELTADHVNFDATGGGTKFDAVWKVTGSGQTSDLSITFHLGFGGFMGLFEPLMKGSVRKEMTQAGENIKNLLEASRAGASPPLP